MPLTHEELMKDSLYRYIYKEVEQTTRWFQHWNTWRLHYSEKAKAAELRLAYWTEKLNDYTKLMNEKYDARPIEDKFNSAMQVDGSL